MRFVAAAIMAFLALYVPPPVLAVIDTYYEDFDDRQDDATIDGVDNWSVDTGTPANAVTQGATTFEGGGKALELIGAETAVSVSNAEDFEQVSPTWIEFIVKPGVGSQTRAVPSSSAVAVTFDQTGVIYAADGTSWADTGATFTSGEWYRIALKLDFSTHLYDIYISPLAAPDAAFIPDKENLQFIDTSINSITQMMFGGVYNSSGSGDDAFIDDLVVHFINRLEVVTASHVMAEGEPSGAITVQLQNALSEPQTAWTDITLELSSTSAGGGFSLSSEPWFPITQLTVPDGSQGATFYYKDAVPGNPIIYIDEYPDRGWQGAMQQQAVTAEIFYFDIAAATPQVAGANFTFQVTAKDDNGEIDEAYGGEISINTMYVSPDTGTMRISPQSLSGFQNGFLEVTAAYPDCGTIRIEVVDSEEAWKSGVSGDILFIPDSFGLVCSSPQAVGGDFPLTVTAYNALGEIAPNYKGPAALAVIPVNPASVPGAAIIPASLGESSFEEGVAEASASYGRWGSIQIKAADEEYPAHYGISQTIEFRPFGITVSVAAPSIERDFFYIGENMAITISLTGTDGQPIVNYGGNVGIDATMGLDIPDSHQFTAGDEGSCLLIASADDAGKYTVRATDLVTGLTGIGPEITVKEATIEIVDTEAPVGGSAEVTIQLVDENGNVITSENDITITIFLTEDINDDSAVLNAQEVMFSDGIANILVSNTQAESVTVSAKSKYKFKIKKGTVTFGRIAKTGVGVIMWREVDE